MPDLADDLPTAAVHPGRRPATSWRVLPPLGCCPTERCAMDYLVAAALLVLVVAGGCLAGAVAAFLTR